MSFDLDLVRAQFPALALTDSDSPRIYFDNPAGTQVPKVVIEDSNDRSIQPPTLLLARSE